MATERKDRGRVQDRRKVAGRQDHEVRSEVENMGASRNKVRRAVTSEANSRTKVERKLKDQTGSAGLFLLRNDADGAADF